MNRRQAIGIIFSSILVSGLTSYGKKKKRKNKKQGSVKKAVTAQKISGEVVLSEESMTKTYKILGAKSYCFSKAVEGKITSYVGQNITIFGKVVNDKIITIEAVSAKDSSQKKAKVN